LSPHHGFIQGKSAAGHPFFENVLPKYNRWRTSATVRLPISPQISTPASRTVGPAVERRSISGAYGSGTGSDDCLAAHGHSDSFGHLRRAP
jgi:hypothetical protein